MNRKIICIIMAVLMTSTTGNTITKPQIKPTQICNSIHEMKLEDAFPKIVKEIISKVHKSKAHKVHKSIISSYDRELLERIIMTSTGGDDYKMAFANAQVVKDRYDSKQFGKTINDVLTAKGQFERPYYGKITPTVKHAVADIFDHGKRITATKLYFYDNPYDNYETYWNNGKRYVITCGHGRYIQEYWTVRN